jgi:hypothetical protein
MRTSEVCLSSCYWPQHILTQTVYFHPFAISIWIPLALLINFFSKFNFVLGQPLTYPLPLIGFALAALPFMGLVEYLQRPHFTRHMRKVIGAPDLVAPQRFYSLDPRSKVIVFEHNSEVGGVICLDGHYAAEELGTVLGAEEGQLGEEGVLEGAGVGIEKAAAVAGRQSTRSKAQVAVSASAPSSASKYPDTVQIRHLDVDHPLRRAGVPAELIAAGLDHAFAVQPFDAPAADAAGSPAVGAARVIVLTNPLTSWEEIAFLHCGFSLVAPSRAAQWAQAPSAGLLKWTGDWLFITREQWSVKREELFAAAAATAAAK